MELQLRSRKISRKKLVFKSANHRACKERVHGVEIMGQLVKSKLRTQDNLSYENFLILEMKISEFLGQINDDLFKCVPLQGDTKGE